MLAWGMLNFGDGYNKSGTWQTGMDTLKWNTDYLLKTILDDPTDSATSEAAEFYIVYQVGEPTLRISHAECCCATVHTAILLSCFHILPAFFQLSVHTNFLQPSHNECAKCLLCYRLVMKP